MRLLVLTSMFPHAENRFRGVSVFNRTLELAKRCDVRVVSPQTLPGLAADEVVGGIRVLRPRWRRVPKLGVLLDGRRFAAAAAPFVARLQAEGDFDLIDTHWAYPDGFGAVRLGQKLGKPVVLTTRGTDVNEFCFRWPIRRMVRRALDGATRLVAVSGPLKQKMCSVGVPDDKVTVIPNGVDTAVFHPGDRAAARQALGLSPDDTVLLAAGTLVEKKGFQHLIAGLGMAPAPTTARLFIAGRGPYQPALERVAARAGVADRVTLLGHLPLDAMVRWYQAADLFCFGSLREGCPNTIIEALACGTPVVTTPVGAVPDLVQPGQDGVVFPMSAPAAFARALAKALDTAWDREAIAARGSRRSWSHVADEYCRVFEQALANGRAAP